MHYGLLKLIDIANNLSNTIRVLKLIDIYLKKIGDNLFSLKMKRRFLVLLIIIAITGAIAGYFNVVGKVVDYLSIEIKDGCYINNKYKFKLDLPYGWDIRSYPNNKQRKLLLHKIDNNNIFPIIAIGYRKLNHIEINQQIDIDIISLKEEFKLYKDFKIQNKEVIPSSRFDFEGVLKYEFTGNIDGENFIIETEQLYIQNKNVLFWFRLSDLKKDIRNSESILNNIIKSLAFE